MVAGVKKITYFTSAERITLEADFKKDTMLAKVPGKVDVLNFMRKNQTFSKYHWTKIKFAVHNMITAMKKKSK